MDHPFMQAWALMPEAVGAFRGPGTTSGIENLRDGPFRRDGAAFRTDIGNWGWDLSGSPYVDVETAVRADGLIGTALRQRIAATVPRQMRLGFLLEQLPSPDNRVTFDSGYMDALGLPRPVIRYHIDDYTRAGAALARRVSKVVFEAVGAADHTSYDPSWHTYVTWKGQGYALMGAGHLVGTHRLSDRRDDGVVDPDQRHWRLRNVFVVGAGSMRTIGTSNPTLTLAALTLRSVPAMLDVIT
jgi:choline dehydrogenase-like flavoprotein